MIQRLLYSFVLLCSTLVLSASAAVDIQVATLKAPTDATAGYPIDVTITLTNGGDAAAAAGFPIVVYLSPDPAISLFDREIGRISGNALNIGETATQKATVVIPSSIQPGTFTVGVIVDPLNTLNEDRTTLINGVKGISPALNVKVPSADIAAKLVSWPQASSAGEIVNVQWTVKNEGVLPGTALVNIYLSANKTISLSDTLLAQQSVSLEVGQSAEYITPILIPSNMTAGKYTVGIIADPENTLVELFENNNIAASAEGTLVAATLQITTQTLTMGLRGIPYSQSLLAIGGDAEYTWSLASGSLPAGVLLSPNGQLLGSPSEIGVFSPILQVTSGIRSAAVSYVLRVIEPTTALAIVSSGFPLILTGSEISYPLQATGGVLPYVWSLTGTLPSGLKLQDGFIVGKATNAVSPTITVSVTDAQGNKATRAIVIKTAIAGDLSISKTYLDPAIAQQPYSQEITLQGGKAPFLWSIVGGALPKGLSFSTTPTTALITGKAEVLGTFPVTIQLQDSQQQIDRSTYYISVSPSALEIENEFLPNAVRGIQYDVELKANAPTVTWQIINGKLPDGFILTPEGHLKSKQIVGNAVQATEIAVAWNPGKSLRTSGSLSGSDPL